MLLQICNLITHLGFTEKIWSYSCMKGFNPIPAVVLENQDTPSKSHVLCPNMTNDTSLESSCALLLESAKKFANLRKIEFFIAKSSFIVKMFAKKNLSKK